MLGMKDIIAKRLRECREQSGLTQIKVATYCGITEKAYQNYESAAREPKVSILARIAKLYNVSVDYLIGMTDKPAPYSTPSKE